MHDHRETEQNLVESINYEGILSSYKTTMNKRIFILFQIRHVNYPIKNWSYVEGFIKCKIYLHMFHGRLFETRNILKNCRQGMKLWISS